MKFVIAAYFVFSSHAFATQLNCLRKITDSRTEATNVRTDSVLAITRGSTHCEEDNGERVCRTVILDEIASEYSVCSEQVDLREDCFISEEGNYSAGFTIGIKCVNGTSLIFTMDNQKNGKVECLQNDGVQKTWNLGQCKEI